MKKNLYTKAIANFFSLFFSCLLRQSPAFATKHDHATFTCPKKSGVGYIVDNAHLSSIF